MYVDAYFDKEKDTILISERVDGKRVLKAEQPEHVFYYSHASGSHKTIFGDTVRKFSTPSMKKFRYELKEKRMAGAKIFESDINPVFRYLAKHYIGEDDPELNICFFDIEADYHAVKGWAKPHNPFNAITAISFYLSEKKTNYTLALCPPTLSEVEGRAITDQFPDTELFMDDKHLLERFMEMTKDVDVFSGWNSEQYDIPYLVNRVKRVLGNNAAKGFCLWDKDPKEREYGNKFGQFKTYEFIGKVHLDYQLLYKKHNPKVKASYKLESIGQEDIGEGKTPYEGNLDQLYKHDFYKFVEYNRQDVNILVKLDKKFRYIDLANQIAHSNGVPFKTTMGSVSLVETAIINYMNSKGLVAPDKKYQSDDIEVIDDDHAPVVGAYVAHPKKGKHRYIGCIDVNSMYPHALIAMNMSPETIFGHIRPDETVAFIAERVSKLSKAKRAEAWEGVFETLEVKHMMDKDDALITIDFVDGTTKTMTGAQLHAYVFDKKNHLCITPNGTLFRTDKKGIIPELLKDWYAQRKEMQAKEKSFANEMEAATTPEAKEEAKYWRDFWNRRQQARKILLNSLYGALLNEALRFYDERLGQSTTLTGRSVVRHMNATVNEIITGVYDYKGDAIMYSDTDSEVSDTIHHTNFGDMTIEAMFELCAEKWKDGDKEYSYDSRMKVLSYDPKTDNAVMKDISYIYRHKVSKPKWKITDALGNEIIVTDDHSVMVERDGELMEMKPRDIQVSDVLISVIDK